MKRFLALLVALFLPCAALADTWMTEVSLTLDEAAFAQDISAQLGMETVDGESILTALAGMLNGMTVRVRSGDGAGDFELLLGGKLLLDFTSYVDAKQIAITSDLMPGYAYAIPNEMIDAVNEMEMGDVAVGMIAAAGERLNALMTPKMEKGSFSGDAYTGGAFCETYILQDKDIAEVLSSTITDDFRMLMKELFGSHDGIEMLDELAALHQRVAEENAHSYVVRLVYDAQQKPLGISVIFLREGVQIATVSYGLRDSNGMLLVIGLGLDQENYWYEHEVSRMEDGSFVGMRREFVGDKNNTYAYTASVQEPVATLEWALTHGAAEDGEYVWNYSHEAVSDGKKSELDCAVTQFADGMLNGSMKLSQGDALIAEITLKHEPCDPIEPMPEGLTICDLASADEEQLALLDESSQLAGQFLGMRLMMIVPMDMLMDLLTMLVP